MHLALDVELARTGTQGGVGGNPGGVALCDDANPVLDVGANLGTLTMYAAVRVCCDLWLPSPRLKPILYTYYELTKVRVPNAALTTFPHIIMQAAHGCHVHAFEIQPEVECRLRMSALRNAVSDTIFCSNARAVRIHPLQ